MYYNIIKFDDESYNQSHDRANLNKTVFIL